MHSQTFSPNHVVAPSAHPVRGLHDFLMTTTVYAVHCGVHDNRTRERSGTMRDLRLGIVVASALTLVLLSAPVRAQQTSAAKPEIEEKAMAVVKRMAAFLTQAQRFSVAVDIGFDVVQDFGQKIEFGETRQMVFRRPDRVRIDATKRNGSKSGMIFDGKAIAAFNTQE